MTSQSIPYALLALLSDRPMYGLQLREEFEARTGEVWPLNVGQVYTTLKRLQRAGLIESAGAEGDAATKAYRMTPAGYEALEGWLSLPSDLSSPPRDELVIKVMVAARVPGVDVHAIIQAHRRYLVTLMQRWTRLKEDGDRPEPSFALAVDAELFRLDAVVRWLDSADARLKRGAAEPASERPTPLPKAKLPNRTGARG